MCIALPLYAFMLCFMLYIGMLDSDVLVYDDVGVIVLRNMGLCYIIYH